MTNARRLPRIRFSGDMTRIDLEGNAHLAVCVGRARVRARLGRGA